MTGLQEPWACDERLPPTKRSTERMGNYSASHHTAAALPSAFFDTDHEMRRTLDVDATLPLVAALPNVPRIPATSVVPGVPLSATRLSPPADKSEPLNNGAAKFGKRRLHPFLAFYCPSRANMHQDGDARWRSNPRNLVVSVCSPLTTGERRFDGNVWLPVMDSNHNSRPLGLRHSDELTPAM